MNEACTIVIRGATQQILEEAERSLHDALCVLTQTVKETRTVFGGGDGFIDSGLKIALGYGHDGHVFTRSPFRRMLCDRK